MLLRIFLFTKRAMSTISSKKVKREQLIAFICDEKDEGVTKIPTHLKSKLIIGNTIDHFISNLDNISSVVWKPPGKGKVVQELYQKIEEKTGTPPTWFHSFFAGVDGVSPYLKNCNFQYLTNGRGAFSRSLAEFNLTAILHFNKQVSKLQDNFQKGKWEMFDMDTVEGKTIGFLGWGSIAQATAKLLKPFHVNLIAYRRNVNKRQQEDDEDEVKFTSDKYELAKVSDYVLNCLPSTPETQDFANLQFFNSMKSSGVFINVGRGATVNQDDLYTSLIEKRIGGAALDVFKVEPLPPTSKLFQAPNLLISNHNADHTIDYIELGWKVFEQNLECFNNGFHPQAESSSIKPTFFDKNSGY